MRDNATSLPLPAAAAAAAGPDGSRDPAAETDAPAYALLVHGKNINEQTLLATDYLNHFNEIVMLLDLVPGMPECLDDAKQWHPKTYQEHFRDSCFTDKELAIAAYEHSPARFRQPFEETIAQMNQVVAVGLQRLEQALSTADEDRIALTAAMVSRHLQTLMDTASAIIHGNETVVDQSAIDQIMQL